MRVLSIILLLFVFFTDVEGQISINNSSFSYTEDFDGLASAGTGNSWTDNSTITGWYSSRTTYNAGTGSSNTGSLYSFGSTSSGERALGSVCSNGTGAIYYGVRFINNTGTAINSFTVEYSGEQWRNGGNTAQQNLNFSFQKDATSLTSGTWTPVSQLDFTGPIASSTAGELNGNLPANRVTLQHTIVVNLAIGEEIWLRWEDPNDSGNDHGLSIDDFSISSIVLPVTFTGISAERKGTEVDILFSTASEVNNDYFTIERSTDGLSFEEAGRIQGAGHSDRLIKYSFTDVAPKSGINYYRVRQTDYDGAFAHSDVVKVCMPIKAITWDFTTDGNTIRVLTQEVNPMVRIVDATGRNMLTVNNLTPGDDIFIGFLPVGMYFLEFSGDHFRETKRMIKP